MEPSRSSVVQIPSDCQHDLLWSFQPIFYSMQILGINLNISQSSSKFRRFGFLTLATFILTYNTTANVMKYYMHKSVQAPETTQFWVETLKNKSTMISSIMMPLIFVVTAMFKWKELWKKLRKMEQSMNFTNFTHQLRKIVMCTSSMVIFFIILVNHKLNR